MERRFTVTVVVRAECPEDMLGVDVVEALRQKFSGSHTITKGQQIQIWTSVVAVRDGWDIRHDIIAEASNDR